MSREVCGICWCPYDEDTGECACKVPSDCADSHQPVAWIYTDPDKPSVKFLEWRQDEPGYRGRWIKTPIYTAPTQRKPLTEDEIALIVADCSASTHRHDDFHFVRAIERAHGIE